MQCSLIAGDNLPFEKFKLSWLDWERFGIVAQTTTTTPQRTIRSKVPNSNGFVFSTLKRRSRKTSRSGGWTNIDDQIKMKRRWRWMADNPERIGFRCKKTVKVKDGAGRRTSSQSVDEIVKQTVTLCFRHSKCFKIEKVSYNVGKLIRYSLLVKSKNTTKDSTCDLKRCRMIGLRINAAIRRFKTECNGDWTLKLVFNEHVKWHLLSALTNLRLYPHLQHAHTNRRWKWNPTQYFEMTNN